jgi:hypothetical protein
MQEDLLGYVQKHIADYKGSITALAREVGVKPSWLRMFAIGSIPNPGVKQVQLLAAHFRGLEARTGTPSPAPASTEAAA